MKISNLLCELENAIKNKNNIVIYNMDNLSVFEKLISMLDHYNREVKLWSKTVDGFENYDNIDKLLSADEMDTLMSIYNLYEFSDKVILLSDDNNYPSIMNYIRQGILSEDEMIEALTAKFAGE